MRLNKLLLLRKNIPAYLEYYFSIKNLFNKNKAMIGYRIGQGGTEFADSNTYLSEYIEVQPNRRYKRNYIFINLYNRVAFYDKNKKTISLFDGNNQNYIETPTNTVYVRFGGYLKDLDNTIFYLD